MPFKMEVQGNEELLEKFRTRARISGVYIQPFMDRASRMYKIYNAIADSIEGLDEEEKDLPNIFLPYAYGIIENIVASTVEPLFQLKPPCRVKPRKAQQEDQAEGFSTYVRNVYNDPEYQMGYIRNTKEAVITGWAWEQTCYVQRWIEGKKWEVVPTSTIVDKLINVLGKLVPSKLPVEFNRLAEVPYTYEDRQGIEIKFPSVFDVFPEPGVRETKKMHWLITLERNVSVDDLRKQFYTDPKDASQKIPVFNLEAIEKAYGQHNNGEIQPGRINSLFQFDYGEDLQQTLRGSSVEEQFRGDPKGDIDRVHLAHIFEPNLYYCVAITEKGDYVVSVKKDPYHKPGIPFDLKVYVQDNLTPFGISALQPIEHMLYEMNDIHNLSMQSYFQLANKMLLIKEDAIVSWDDFDPRAGGKVRIRNTKSVGEAAMPVEHADGTQSMLAHESNSKGLIEWASGAADLSPGVQGTKQSHDTLGGLQEIQHNLGRRTGILRRQFLTTYQTQMYRIHDFLAQFQFETVLMASFDENGKQQPDEFERDDLVLPDGPNLVIEYDPSYGDEQILRNHLMFALNLSMQYEEFRLAKRPDLPVANVAESYRKMLNALGWDDTSEMLKAPDGILDPQKEFEMIMQGQPVRPNPRENFIQHHMEHDKQLNSPELQALVASGKVSPEAVLALRAHDQATVAMGEAALKFPQQVSRLIQSPAQAQPMAPAGMEAAA